MFLSFCLFFSAFAFVAFSVVSPCSSDLLFVRAACVLIFAASLLFSPLVAFALLGNAETRRQAVLAEKQKRGERPGDNRQTERSVESTFHRKIQK